MKAGDSVAFLSRSGFMGRDSYIETGIVVKYEDSAVLIKKDSTKRVVTRSLKDVVRLQLLDKLYILTIAKDKEIVYQAAFKNENSAINQALNYINENILPLRPLRSFEEIKKRDLQGYNIIIKESSILD